MNIKILTILMTITFVFSIQNNGKRVVESFIKTIANKDVQIGRVMDQYLCLETDTNALRSGLITTQLEYLRKELGCLTSPPTVVAYDKLPSSEQNISFDERVKTKIFGVKNGGKTICMVLVREGKIASFSTMNKGSKRVFLEICK